MVSHEVWREIATVELHTFNPFNVGIEAVAFVDGDNSVFTNLGHCICEQSTDTVIIIGSDGGNICHFITILNLNGHLLKLSCDIFNGLFNAGLHLHRVYTGHDSFESFIENRFRHYGCCCGTVTSNITGFASHFAYHAGAHVFIDILKVDFLSD